MESEDSPIDIVPIEIIAKIFQYLPTSYWKQARLVCSKWYTASNDPTVMKNKKFVFGISEASLVHFHSLEKDRFGYLNLEFADQTFLEADITTFFETHNSRIFSLTLERCTFSFETLKTIMRSCTNLQELRFLGATKLLTSSPLPAPNEIQIKRRNLESLKVFRKSCDEKWMSDLLFTILISVYPNVTKLILDNVINFDPVVFESLYKNANCYSPSDQVFTYRHFYQTISKKCHKIEHLNINSNFSSSLSDDDLTTLASTPCIKLKSCYVSYHSAISSTGFKNLFSRQSDIISLNVSNCQNFDMECLKILLEQIPNLEGLIVTFEQDVSETELHAILAKSKLKGFLCKNLIYDDEATPTDYLTCNNEHMEALDLSITYEDIGLRNGDFCTSGVLFLQMLKTFTHLKYLSLRGCERVEEGRQLSSYIFTHLVHLKELNLTNATDWIEDASFKNTSGCLKNLKFLDLIGCFKLTKRAIKTFNFPKLIRLDLSNCNRIDYVGFDHLPQSSPLLEHLILSGTSISDKALLRICRKLKFLRRLNVKDIVPSVAFATVEKILSSCPNLRIEHDFEDESQ